MKFVTAANPNPIFSQSHYYCNFAVIMENKKLKKHSTPSSFEDKQIFLSEIH
jgi:hypothetical protein